MTTTTTPQCDMPVDGSPCGRPADLRYAARFDSPRGEALILGADICSEHQQAFLLSQSRLGVHGSGAWVGRKQRGCYTARSGLPFTTNEARQWLIEQGHDVSRGPGRLAQRHLDLYAETH